MSEDIMMPDKFKNSRSTLRHHVLVIQDRSAPVPMKSSDNEVGLTVVALRDANAADLPECDFLVVDVPLFLPDITLVLSSLLAGIPSSTPRLFVVDRKNRLEVVRANVLGASLLANRPLSSNDLRFFFGSHGVIAAYDTNGGERTASSSSSLGSVFEDLIAGRAIEVPAVESAAEDIIEALDQDGLENWLQGVRDHHQGTMQHSLIVAGVMTRFGQQAGMSTNDIKTLTRIGLLHDVGKVKIPNAILDKPGRLTEEEFEVIKTHPREGYIFLQGQGALAGKELDAVLGHHEYLDGSGYPNGLMGNNIGDLVRITTICDIYGALVERRSYRAEMKRDDALAVLNQMAQTGKVERPLVRALERSLD